MKFPMQMLTSGLSRLIWWFKGSLVLRSTNRKIGYSESLDEVIVTRDGDFARIGWEEGDIPAILLQIGPGIIVPIVPEVHRRPMLEVRETRAEE